MEVVALPEQDQSENGAPVEGAEATRSVTHLFAYSRVVHVGEGADECEHRDDGQCQDQAHFHAWLCLPNTLQRQDILEKAKAARARRRRALSEEATDGYAILEAELDELMDQDREPILRELAQREAGKGAVERIRDMIENEERFNNYWQDAEEYDRLKALPEEERPQEEFGPLEALVKDFEATVDRQSEETTETELERLKTLDDAQLRRTLRDVRVKTEGAEAHQRAYMLWMGFICTRSTARRAHRYFDKLEEYRNASPEAVEAVEETLQDLEGRQARGEAAGN